MKAIIALTGVKGSGKTTSFNFIRERYPNAIEVTLAKRLKDVSAEVFNIPRAHFDDPAFKEVELDQLVVLDEGNVSYLIKAFGHTPDFDLHVRPHLGKVLVSPRHIAQYVGTEVLRAAIGEDVHCEGAMLGQPSDGLFIVTDMRFPNEFEYFKRNFPNRFYPIYVHNPKAEAEMGPNPHASEKYVLELGKRSERVDNIGTLSELQAKVLKIVDRIAGYGLDWNAS